MTATIPDNPFPLEGVATYGKLGHHCPDLDYVTQAIKELQAYVVAYPRADQRYGGAVGLRGGHGSGKTHVLSAIAAEASGYRKLPVSVLYAKADRASFFDLYGQLMTNLTRVKIQELIGEVLLRLAVEAVTKASVTESIAERITSRRDLRQLVKEGNLDMGQLQAELRERLEGPLKELGIPEALPRMLLLVDSPGLGEQAFEWLRGKDVVKLEPLGMSVQLRGLTATDDDNSGPDIAAIQALETVAALHRIAGRSLVALVDQLEVLLRAEGARRDAMFSGIKKLIEHLARQDALLYLAGNPDSWESLPRDVPPRLRSRAPIVVGNLNEAQTAALLHAYSEGTAEFGAPAVKTIQRLAGGSPREALRIAHRVYRETLGNVAAASDDVFVLAAQNAGSLADREQLALTLADRVLAGWAKRGDVIQDIDAGDGAVLQRLLRFEGRPKAGLMTLPAADSVGEARAAKGAHSVFKYVEEKWPGTPVIVVAIGYGTQDVARLLGRAATVMEFNEYTFASQLQSRLLEVDTAPARETAAASTIIDQKLDRIFKELETLETRRKQETDDAAKRFAESARKLAAPERQRREIRTRWDMRSEIDELTATPSPPDEQKQRMESLLVVNEAVLKDKELETLGDAYLEALALEAQFGPGAYNVDVSRWGATTETLLDLKKEILRDMRRLLRAEMLPIRRRPLVTAAALAGATLAIGLILFFTGALDPLMGKDRAGAVVGIFVSPFVIGGYTYAVLLFPAYRGRKRWRMRLEVAHDKLSQSVKTA